MKKMRQLAVIGLFIVAMLAHFEAGYGQGQSSRCQNPAAERELSDFEQEPKRGAPYANVAKFKLASRKTEYRQGEMISVDMAMLNISKSPVFFRKLSGNALTFSVSYEKEAATPLLPNLIVLEGIVSQSFRLVETNKLTTGSYQVLAGCDSGGEKSFSKVQEKMLKELPPGRDADKIVFEKDLFITWGDACLLIKRPGTYTITVEAHNNYVVKSPCEPNIKTAVGTIQSTPLTITITE